MLSVHVVLKSSSSIASVRVRGFNLCCSSESCWFWGASARIVSGLRELVRPCYWSFTDKFRPRGAWSCGSCPTDGSEPLVPSRRTSSWVCGLPDVKALAAPPLVALVLASAASAPAFVLCSASSLATARWIESIFAGGSFYLQLSRTFSYVFSLGRQLG